MVYRKSDGLFIHPIDQDVFEYCWREGIEGACLYWYADAKRVRDELRDECGIISLELAKKRFPQE